MKNCKKCNVEKDIECFEFRKDIQKHRNVCKPCNTGRDSSLVNYSTKEQQCVECKSWKSFSEYAVRHYPTGSVGMMPKCKECVKATRAVNSKKAQDKWHSDPGNKLKTSKYSLKYYAENRDSILSNSRASYYATPIAKHRARTSNYRKKNDQMVRMKRNASNRIKRKTDVFFALRSSISRGVRNGLHNRGKSKNWNSCLKFLPYTINELKSHLESQFESWMNWKNYGTYRLSKWNDNDSTTWTWQIDHIMPHSKFKYTSMEDEEFQKCWALSNLRPLNAKQNLQKGSKVEEVTYGTM